ncbi:phosphoribosylanthranilate isomerase [Streptomyces sp. S186]|uniref:phosphoribosylanthranilate isomerase n=1 Tax=Streptomyces sp. S186 TaxID=3434395 RepID=UPI003F673667
MRVKFCGAVRAQEVRAVAAAGADLVGLWHGVPGGRAELSAARLTELAATARACDLTPVLVTLARERAALVAAAAGAGVEWVQLHGFQPPALVRALKRELPHLTVVKVLHLQRTHCPEAPLIGAYERTGTDVFLLDSAADGRLGSTGRPLDPPAAAALAGRLTRPFLLAGGIGAENRADYAAVTARPGFLGIDVDSAARREDGALDAAKAGAVTRAWRGPAPAPSG